MKKIVSVLLCLVIFLSCLGAVCAQTPRKEAENKTYIVVLDAPALYSENRVSFYSTSDADYRRALLELQEEIKAQIPQAMTFSLRRAEPIEKSYSYTDILNGFTINCDSATAEYIKTIDGVSGVYEDKIIEGAKPAEIENGEAVAYENATTTDATSISQANSGNMINTQSAYDKGFDGTGRAIAIIDSAINPNHIYYAISDESTVKYTKDEIDTIIKNNTLNVSATADTAYKNEKIPYAYNYATNSSVVTASNLHGAHVSGIAAGNSVTVADGIIKGVAPEAQILFFGVFGEDGGALTTDIIAALEDAVKFDVDAINLSLGTANASEYSGIGPYNEAVKNARNAGTTVVFSAGNSDRLSYNADFIDYSTADNRNYLYSSMVGSVQSEYSYMTYLEDENGEKYPCIPKGSVSSTAMTDVVDCGNGTEAEIASLNLSGKVALITMPDVMLSETIKTYGTRAMDAGASAVVISYYSDDISDGSLGYAYPLFMVSKWTGEKIKSAQSLKYVNERAVLPRVTSPRENMFSSYGYGDNLDISVDFSAPGGNIYSSYGGTTGFSTLSGTSMAAPQITGATSLMYQYVESAFPTYTGANKVMLVKNLLASTADTVYDDAGTISSVRKLGAGIINLDKAMETTIILKGKNSKETKINLGADLSSNFSITFTAENLSNSPVTFNDVSVELSTDDYAYSASKGYYFDGLMKLTAQITGAASVTVPANDSCDITVNVSLTDSEIKYLNTAMTNGFFIDGKVTLKTSDTNCDVGIPFSGFYGDWSRQPITTESRFMDYFSLIAYSDYGFTPPMMIVKENNTIVLPVSKNPDESVKDIPVAAFNNTLRNAVMTVKFDGVTVLSDAFINKTLDNGYYLGDKIVGDLSSASKITVELRLPYDTEGKNKEIYTINTVNDATLPIVSDIYVNAKNDGKDYSYITVSDNYGISAISAYAFGEEEYPFIYDVYIGKKSGTAEIEVSGFDEIYYYVYDSAFNAIILEPDINIDVKSGTAYFKNATHKSLSGVCLMAVYDENDKMEELINLGDGALTISPYSEKTFNVSQYEGQTYKLFFWEDIDKTLTPICESYSTNQ